jgi:hypothetical protein
MPLMAAVGRHTLIVGRPPIGKGSPLALGQPNLAHGTRAQGEVEHDRFVLGGNRNCERIIADNTLGPAGRRKQWACVRHDDAGATAQRNLARKPAGGPEVKGVPDGYGRHSLCPRTRHHELDRLFGDDMAQSVLGIDDQLRSRV